jgi:adenylate cyclase
MRAPISVDEFSDLVGIPADDLRAWADEGLLDPERSGRFDELDMLRVMAIRHYAALGYEPEAFARALDEGKVEPFLGEYIYPRGPQLSMDEAAQRLGIDIDVLRALRTALGITRDRFLEGDLELFQGFNVMAAAGMPHDAVLEGARVFGDSLRRLAETEARLVHVHMHERLEAEGLEEESIVRQIDDLQNAVIPLLDAIVERVHHEHLLLAAIEDAYVHLVDTDVRGGLGSVDATIAFIDVESFTQLTEAQGDAAAIETMTRVDSAVRGLALEHGGKVVKQIGDALMLAFRDSADCVGFAAELEQTVRGDTSFPGLRIGMHCGPAIYRGGDYVGKTVNVAARVAGQATAGETLMTEVVAERVGEGFGLEPVGVRILRGVEKPLPLYRLRHECEKHDPVCGKPVKSPPAARLQQDGEELWFCSRRCLEQFLASEAAAE